MSKLIIQRLSYYGFFVLIIAIILSSFSILYFLFKINTANNDLYKIKETSSSFLNVKISTEKLLTSNDLDKPRAEFIENIKIFNKKLKELKKIEYNNITEIENLWYASQTDISQIKSLLNDNVINKKNLHNTPLLKIEGLLFKTNNTTALYATIVTLNQKIQNLIQYETFIIEEFMKMENSNSQIINKNIDNSLYQSIISPIIILIISLIMIYYINRKIKVIESELTNTKEQLTKSFEEIQKSHKFTKYIIDSVPVALFWKDINSNYLGSNANFFDFISVDSTNELIGKNDFEIYFNDNNIQRYIDIDKEVISSGEAQLNYEEIIKNKEGNDIFILASKVPLKDIKGKIIGILGIYLDITQKKKTQIELSNKEKLLSQQSKMAAMGEMLENIAHQWRQPLSVITTGASGIKLEKEYGILKDEFLIETLDSMMVASNHLSTTIDDFREFFKEDKQKDYFRIDEVIQKSMFILSSKFKNRNIDVVSDIDNIQIYGFKNEMIQVIMNILNNSNDVLEKLEEDDKYIFIDAKTDNDRLKLTIKDSGGGIPEDIINKVFEPYFTTKHKSQGTGIGLYMSEEIVVKHMGGKISVENIEYSYKNKNYKGAGFTIYLPLTEEKKEKS
ncbi:MAG: PAS domain-containing sensor histidine kinase [Campylobacterota bacterium]|nr:PAS domain-containing sensor histidine kinase [Campylobacterota bacterium]